MSTSRYMVPTYLALALFAASCATMQPTAGVQDDIYYMPSDPPVETAAKNSGTTTEQGSTAQRSDTYADDYYDPRTAQNYDHHNYYDMAYNDPYYYNYGRFGFGTGMGWQSGWSGPGWGMGMGYGYPIGNSWSMSLGYGYGSGFYDPWYGGYYPYGGYWGRPIGYAPYGAYDPFYGGYGAGNYYGPYGSCYACYTPVVVGGSSGVVVGHRPSIGSNNTGNAGSNTVTQPRMFRDPVGLTPDAPMDRSRSNPIQDDRRAPIYSTPPAQPERSIFRQGNSRQEDRTRQPDRGISIDRSGGSDRNDSSPSRSGGGGSRTINSPRPR